MRVIVKNALLLHRFPGLLALGNQPRSLIGRGLWVLGGSQRSPFPHHSPRFGYGSIGIGASVRVALLCEPWFYLRLGRWGRPDAFSGSAGEPTVIRVPRRTVGRANVQLETAPRTSIPDSGAASEGNAPHRSLVDPGLSWLAPSASLDRSVLLSSTAGA